MFEGAVVGKAMLGKMCSYLASGGINSVSSQRIFSVTAAVLTMFDE